jgi:hypothetical protein
MSVVFGSQQSLFACGRSAQTSPVQITAESGSYKVRSPYNPKFVEQLKLRIPATARAWDNSSKCWFVAASYGNEIKKLCDEVYGGDVVLPTILGEKAQSFECALRVDYLANCKQEVANVHSLGSWSAKIPESVLRAWFKQTDANAGTLYGLLNCDEKAAGAEIKSAYRRAARVWHPDICREENAREMFEKIKEAYDVLSNPETRNKYNAGLMFERMAKMSPKASRFSSFTPPFRCGDLKVKARREMGQLIVEEILEWNDIKDDFGRIMTSYWDGDSFSVMWV